MQGQETRRLKSEMLNGIKNKKKSEKDEEKDERWLLE